MKENIIIIPLSGGGKAVVNLNYVVGAYPIAEGGNQHTHHCLCQ